MLAGGSNVVVPLETLADVDAGLVVKPVIPARLVQRPVVTVRLVVVLLSGGLEYLGMQAVLSGK